MGIRMVLYTLILRPFPQPGWLEIQRASDWAESDARAFGVAGGCFLIRYKARFMNRQYSHPFLAGAPVKTCTRDIPTCGCEIRKAIGIVGIFPIFRSHRRWEARGSCNFNHSQKSKVHI